MPSIRRMTCQIKLPRSLVTIFTVKFKIIELFNTNKLMVKFKMKDNATGVSAPESGFRLPLTPSNDWRKKMAASN